VEMLVAITILVLIMGGLTALLSRGWKVRSFVMEEGDVTKIAAAGIDSLSSDFDLVVYLNDDDDDVVERAHYFLEDNQLKKGIRNPDANCVFASGDETETVVANYVMNESSQPIFRFYNQDYPGDIVNNPLSTSPSLAVDQVRLIRVHLWINIKPLTAPDNVNFETFVNLRNLNENI